MAARQIPLGTQGLRPWTIGAGERGVQGFGRGTAAARNNSRRYGLARPRCCMAVRQAWRMTSAAHIPVLGREAVDYLAPRAGGIYVDATFGGGGYSRAILDVAGTRLIAIDRDRTAIAGGA